MQRWFGAQTFDFDSQGADASTSYSGGSGAQGLAAPANRIAAIQYAMNSAVTVWHTSAQAKLTITYQFAGNSQPADPQTPDYTGWTAYTSTQKAAVRDALAEYAEILNVQFVEVSGVTDPDIVFGRVNLPFLGGEGGFSYSYQTNGQGVVTQKALDGFVAIDTDVDIVANPNLLLHEIGHAMTLKHAGNYNVGGGGSPAPYLPANEDNNKYSVMSYNDNPDNNDVSDHLMLYDIAALQARFGANLTYRTGDDTYTGPNGNIETIWDAGGTDTFSGVGRTASVTIDLREASFSSLGGLNNLSIAYGVVIENAIGGSGADTITGNDVGNFLSGGGGNDTINGGLGEDDLRGGAGNDTLNGEGGVDDWAWYDDATAAVTVSLAITGAQAVGGGMGSDTLSNIEGLAGSAYGDTLTGNSGNNYLFGGSGADTLIGGAGNDTMEGDAGADTVSYANATGGVSVNLSITTAQAVGGGEGSDILLGIEYLTGSAFADTLTGNDGINILNGGAGGDTLAGAGGADTLNGGDGNDAIFGGLGLDDMYGGDGDDLLYIADNDGIIEGGAGYDQAIVLTTNSVNVTIETGVEYVAGNNGNDVLSAAGTSTSIVIGGAAGNDILTGGSAGDTLAGNDGTDEMHGGLGNDTIFGGTGSDNFYGDEGDDLLYILGNDGTIDGGSGYDQVIVLDTAGVSITIGSGVEYVAGNNGDDTLNASSVTTAITLGGAVGDDIVRGGSADDIMSGSFGDDDLYGNGGNDILFGGDNDDRLFGGTGNDSLYTGNGNDVCFIEDLSGADVVSGFADGLDTFNFSLHSSVDNFADLTISTAGSDTSVTFAGGSLLLLGISASAIDAGDFVFA